MSDPIEAPSSEASSETGDQNAPGLIEYLTTGVPGYVTLALLVLVCYWSVPQFAYVWRDNVNIAANPTLRSFAGLSRIWTELAASPQFMPLTYTSYWAEVRLFGVSSVASHAFNLILHLANVLLLWTVLRRLAVPGAWVAAAIFAVHPINVESVAWVSQRSTLLSLTFGLAATYFFVRQLLAPTATVPETLGDLQDSQTPVAATDNATEPPEEPDLAVPPPEGLKLGLPDHAGRLFGLFIAMFVLSLLSRPATATLPLVLAAIAWWKAGRLQKQTLLSLLSALIIGLAIAAIAVHVEHDPAAVGATGREFVINPLERLQLVGTTLGFYLLKLVAPFPLIFNYPRWTLSTANVLLWLPLLCVVALVGGLIALTRKIGRGPAAAAISYVLLVLPISGVISFYLMRYAWVFDHGAYAAGIAPIVLAVAAVAFALKAMPETVLAAAGAVVIAVFAFLTASEYRGGSESSRDVAAAAVHESPTFADERSLWETTIRQNKQSWLAAAEYGNWAMRKGIDDYVANNQAGDPDRATSERKLAFQRSRVWLERAIKLNPDCYEAYDYLGNLDLYEGKPTEALKQFLEADRVAVSVGSTGFIEPKHRIAQIFVRTGDLQNAQQTYQQLQAIEPEYAPRQAEAFAAMRVEYGDLLLRMSKVRPAPNMKPAEREVAEAAMNEYLRGVEIAPDSVPPKLKLAQLLLETDNTQPALDQLRDALEIDKNNISAKYLAAIAAQKIGDYESAGAQLMNLLQADPSNLPAQVKLAEIFNLVGRKDEAVGTLQKVLQAAPGYPPAAGLLARITGSSATSQPATGPSTMPDLINMP